MLRDFSPEIVRLWEEHEEFQTEALTGIVKNIRHISDADIADKTVKYLKSLGAFYVPSGKYMRSMIPGSTDQSVGIFDSSMRCSLTGRLALPLRMMDGTVVSFVGYSPKPKDLQEGASWIKYRYPSAGAFAKDRYMYIEPEEFKQAHKDGYICIVDGLFDKITLQVLGINAVSLCGSALTRWHRMYLASIPRKVVIADNDEAGRKLYMQCRYAFGNCIEIRQSQTADIDDFVKTHKGLKAFMDAWESVKLGGFMLSKTIPKIGGLDNVKRQKEDSGKTNLFGSSDLPGDAAVDEVLAEQDG